MTSKLLFNATSSCKIEQPECESLLLLGFGSIGKRKKEKGKGKRKKEKEKAVVRGKSSVLVKERIIILRLLPALTSTSLTFEAMADTDILKIKWDNENLRRRRR
jgi:hypothetical protein